MVLLDLVSMAKVSWARERTNVNTRRISDDGATHANVEDEAGLRQYLKDFFNPDLGPALLEIESSMTQNTLIFEEFKARIQNLRPTS